MKYKDLLKILDEKDYSWIKVKRYDEEQEKSLVEFGHFDEALELLKEHHEKETKFLIETCRKLAWKLQLECYVDANISLDDEI